MTKVTYGAGGGGGGGQPTIEADTLLSNDTVEFVLGLCEGPIAGLVNGPNSFYLDETPLVNQIGENNFDPFRLTLYHGDALATPVVTNTGGISSTTQVGVTLAQNVPVTRSTQASLRNQIDQLEVRINVNQLVNTAGGNQVQNVAEFDLEYRPEGSSTWLPFTNGYATEWIPTSTVPVTQNGITNLMLQSDNFGAAPWVATGVTLTPVSETGYYIPVAGAGFMNPLTVPSLRETATNGPHHVQQTIAGFTAGQMITFSTSLKIEAAGGRSRARLSMIGAPGQSYIDVDLRTSQVTGVQNTGGASVPIVNISVDERGWLRISMTGRVDTTSTSITFRVALLNDAGAVSYLGNAALGMLIKQAQVQISGTGRERIVGKTTAGFVQEYVRRVPRIPGDWEIRLTKRSVDGSTTDVVVLAWESFQSVTLEDRAYNSLAVVHGRGQSSDQFSSIPQFSGVYHCKVVRVPTNYDPLTRHYAGIWDGTFKFAHTDNPAWCLYDLLMDETYGFKRHYPQLVVDRFSFYDFARFCDQFVPRPGGGFQPRYTFNDVLRERRSGPEYASYIAGAFGAVFVRDFNTVKIKFDAPGSIVQIVAEESITPDGFQYQFTDVTTRVNDVLVKFVNPNLNWQEDVRQVFIQQYIDDNGRIPEEITVVGCNDVYEAQRRAYYRILQANTELLTVSFQMPRSGIQLEPYDLIGISDPNMNWGISGRVHSRSGSQITLRDPLFVPAMTPLTMQLQTPTGIVTLTVQAPTTNATVLNITSGTWPANAPARAQFTLSSSAVGFVKPFRVMTIEESAENSDLFTITALEFNVNKLSDADNMEFSGTVDYGFAESAYPDAPVITAVQSGTEHLYLNSDGTVVSRIFVQWDQPPRSFSREFDVSFRRRGFEEYRTIRTNRREIYIDNAQDGAVYDIFVRAINPLGRIGRPSATVSHTVVGKTQAPSTPTGLTAVQQGRDVVLTWNAVTDIDLLRYEIRQGASWATGLVVGTPNSTRFIDRNINSNSLTYWVRSVDTSGNYSTGSATVVHAVPAPDAPDVTLTFAGENFVIDIVSNPLDPVPVAEFVVTTGAVEVFRGNATRFTGRVDWVGAQTFQVVTINQAGRPSTPVLVTGTVMAPAAPNGNVQVIDNNVLLRWTPAPGTLPIMATEIRKGPVFASAEVLQSMDANFSTFFETVAATYTYWLVHIDSAGNYGAPRAISAQVSEPPDFILVGDFTANFVTATKSNMVYEPQTNSLFFGLNPAETYQQHFVNNGFASPQAQVSAGRPYYLQPTSPGLGSFFREEYDAGTVIGSSLIVVTPTMTVIAGDPNYEVDIEYRASTGDAWTLITNSNRTFATNFRYVRVTIRYVGNSTDDLLQMTRVETTLNLRLKNDAGSGVAAAADPSGTAVTFNVDFVDVASISVTPLSTTPRVAVYDFADTPNPTGFTVYLFDTTGARVSGPFSWTARGY